MKTRGFSNIGIVRRALASRGKSRLPIAPNPAVRFFNPLVLPPCAPSGTVHGVVLRCLSPKWRTPGPSSGNRNSPQSGVPANHRETHARRGISPRRIREDVAWGAEAAGRGKTREAAKGLRRDRVGYLYHFNAPKDKHAQCVVDSRLPLADCLPVADGWTDDRAVMLPKKLQGFALGSVVERRPSGSLPPLGFVSHFDASLRLRNRRACSCHTRERSAGCK